MPLHLVGLSGGRIWHTIRRPNANVDWTPWEDVTSLVPSALPGTPSRVACATVMDTLQVCVLTSAGLFHTIQFTPTSWQAWGNAGVTAFPQVILLSNVDCAGTGEQLHVCIDGLLSSRQNQTLPAVWRSIRIPTKWSAAAEVTNRYEPILNVACAQVTPAPGERDELHVLARAVDITSADVLMHNIELPSGASQPAGDQDVFRLFPNAAALRLTRTVAAAGIGPELHVVASDGTELFHTIRLNNSAWQSTFGLVRPAVDPTFTAPLENPACANDGGNLHVCAISGGRIMHTIRISSPPEWRNPENATSGSFGDVLAAVPAGSGGVAPPPTFDDIACAGVR